jgi:CPA2 family monovalent cation:H+ antiporter-2
MHDALSLALILLAAAVFVVVLFRRLDLPPLLGYLMVGIGIGPHASGLLPDVEHVAPLAEFGVVFLMFSIGLEFSLPKLMTMRRLVFGLGTAQVVLTAFLAALVVKLAGQGWAAGLVVGAAATMSSTAILGKMLAEKLELNSAHGRQIMGVLLFQDLAVVPLLILLPAVAAGGGALWANLLDAAWKAAVLLALLLGVGQRLMRPWFAVVAARRSPELFTLNVLLITLLLAWLTEQAGLSLALGAFVAGMLISETPYRFQVEEDIKPFRDLLLGLFFVSVGARLDLALVWQQAAVVGAVVAGLLALKAALVAGLARLFGADAGTAMRTGLALAGAGEFGFVMLSRGAELQMLSPGAQQVVLAALVLSMLASPFIVQESERLVRRWIGSDWMTRAMALHNIAVQTMGAQSHVIICGYGRSGQNLARILEQEAIAFVALDLDPRRVQEASLAGESVVFGDAARTEVLLAAGLMRAAAVVVSYADTHSALRILEVVRSQRPGMPVIVRTLDEADLDTLRNAGAAEVVAEIMEGSLMLASHALMLLGVPFNRVLRRIRATREQRYSLFRGFYPGMTDSADEEPVRLHSVQLPPGAAAIGRRLEDMDFARARVDVTAIRRHGVRGLDPAPQTILEEGDVLVLKGREADLAVGEALLLSA